MSPNTRMERMDDEIAYSYAAAAAAVRASFVLHQSSLKTCPTELAAATLYSAHKTAAVKG